MDDDGHIGYCTYISTKAVGRLIRFSPRVPRDSVAMPGGGPLPAAYHVVKT